MFWLLLFGLIHAYFIWVGDILVAYAICGSLVFFFRKKSIRTLFIIAVILFLVPISLNFMTYYVMPKEALESTFTFFYPSTEQIALQTKIMQGSYLEQMPLRLEIALELQTFVFMNEISSASTNLFQFVVSCTDCRCWKEDILFDHFIGLLNFYASATALVTPEDSPLVFKQMAGQLLPLTTFEPILSTMCIQQLLM